ncbi:MAG: hypothetical protein KF891_05130 [Rhizobacter sp.]|nr:hypothetical protein [Rhizobacter sp.]
MKRAIAFLDFDGVCHPVHCPVDQLFVRLPLVEGWLRAQVHVDLVISSSWREHHQLGEIQSFFAEDLQHRVIGVTPITKVDPWAQHDPEAGDRYEREAEVMQWLRNAGALWRAWVAFDDQAALFKPFNSRLVLCNPRTGLTLRELRCASAVLHGQR